MSSFTPCGGEEFTLVLLDIAAEGAVLLLLLFVFETSDVEVLAERGAKPTSLLKPKPVLDVYAGVKEALLRDEDRLAA